MNIDFSGWATKNNLRCSDGRVIVQNAFAQNDGEVVPLVWNHDHDNPQKVIGKALLKNEAGGVRAYCSLNDGELADYTRTALKHGDINALSIYANQLQQNGPYVEKGNIREVSVVLASANPGASIDSVTLSHSDDGSDDEGIIYTGEELELMHSDDEGETMGYEYDDDDNDDGSDFIEDTINSMTDDQYNVMCALVGQASGVSDDDDEDGYDDEEDYVADDDEEGYDVDDDDDYDYDDDYSEDDDMQHNVFDSDDNYMTGSELTHSDEEAILNTAKQTNVGTFKAALEMYAADNGVTPEDVILQHDGLTASPVGGFPQSGDGNVGLLFPEYKDLRPGAPELLTNDQGWITIVMNKVHKSPISRIRTGQVDIRNLDALRAKGYKKGDQKTVTGNIKLVRRTTDPQTVYVKNALYRDDITDITDFDYVAYLYNIDRMMLNEELATAIMLGDGRDDGDANKISPEHIRPIWTDDDLYTIHKDLDLTAARKELQGTNTGANFGENYIYAEAIINAVLYSRENFKGSGTPDFFVTPHILNVMLLARDMNGRRIYSSKAELASALNVGSIVTAEQFENKIRTTKDSKKKKLLGLMCNLADYSLGATKGGEVSHFTQFDLDFNQEKSLLETRVSGALTRVYSAIALEEDVTNIGG